MVNLHFSLLPRWRGAAPVERALLAGDDETGVCLMQLEEGLDTGPVYAAVVVPIGADDHGCRAARRAGRGRHRLLVDELRAGLGAPEPQEGEPTYAAKIDPDELQHRLDAAADRDRSAGAPRRRMDDVPGKRLKVVAAELTDPTAAAVDGSRR